MATVTGKTAAAMDAIADASVTSGVVTAGHLHLTTHGGDDIDAGSVIGPTGATGATGATGPTGGGSTLSNSVTGPPTTGTYSVGQLWIDEFGVMYVCSVAGSPGTWGQVNKRFLYTSLSSNVSLGTNTMTEILTLALPAGNWKITAETDLLIPETTATNACAIDVKTGSVSTLDGKLSSLGNPPTIVNGVINHRMTCVARSSSAFTIRLSGQSAGASGGTALASKTSWANVATSANLTSIVADQMG